MTTALVGTERTILAKVAATAWLNAAVASSQDSDRSPIYRTLCVEFFPAGVQFIGCDGTMLFRTWAPYSDDAFDSPQPTADEAPDDRIVVSDVDKFALGFMRTLLSAAEDYEEISLSIEPAGKEEEPPLGEELTEYTLSLTALGQHLSCPLYEGQYPDWRKLEFGLDPAELVDGMTLATRLFQSVGKLKGVAGVDCTFRGTERAIEIQSTEAAVASLRGLLMPMRRPDTKKKASPTAEQTSHA